MPHMHNLWVTAMTKAHEKVMQTGQPVDRPLTREELPFEVDGTDRARRYYTDVDQSPGGILTWATIFRTYEGLLRCVWKRGLYREVYFEIWQRPQEVGQREVKLGTGEFGLFKDGPALDTSAAA